MKQFLNIGADDESVFIFKFLHVNLHIHNIIVNKQINAVNVHISMLSE